LAGVRETDLVPLLEGEPGLQRRTLFEALQRRHGDRSTRIPAIERCQSGMTATGTEHSVMTDRFREAKLH